MTSKQQYLVGFGAMAAIAGVAIYFQVTAPPLAHAVVAIDPSASVERNCPGVRDFTRTLVSGKPGIGDGSRLAVLTMGTSSADTQPKRRVDEAMPVEPDSVYGQAERKAAFRQSQDALFEQVKHACEGAPSGRQSPVYEMTRQGIAHLRGLGCAPGGTCLLIVKSDLDEDVQSGLRDTLRSAAKPDALPATLAGSLDNAGIEIHVCGMSEVRAARQATASSPDRRVAIWTKLFTAPQLFSVRPYCGEQAGA